MQADMDPGLSSDRVVRSESFVQLEDQFSHFHLPFSAEDARAFSRIYRKVYRELSATERKEAEHMVDLLIAGLEKREHAPLIFGVV